MAVGHLRPAAIGDFYNVTFVAREVLIIDSGRLLSGNFNEMFSDVTSCFVFSNIKASFAKFMNDMILWPILSDL